MTVAVTITSTSGPAKEFKQLDQAREPRWELTLIGRGGETPGGVWTARDVVEAVREATLP